MKHTSETFLSVPGYEGLYEVSDKGNVKSLRSGKLLKQSSNKDGYKMVSLTKNGKSRGFSVHRLVALTFIPNPQGLPEVNHKDETHDNNVLENLEWCSKAYNRNYGTYRERMSMIKKGKPRATKKLTLQDLEPKRIIDLTPSAETKFFNKRSEWLQENECLDEEMAIEVINF